MLFLFVAPGLAFLMAFAAAARCRRRTQSDGVRSLIEIFLTAAVIHLLFLSVSQFFSDDPIKDLAELFTSEPCAAAAATSEMVRECRRDIGDMLSTAWSYGMLVVILAAVAGFCLSKLIAWNVVQLGFYYGPLYPVIRGFYRRHIIVTIISKVTVEATKREEIEDGGVKTKREETLKTPIMYRGRLDELRLDHAGKIEYISLLSAGKALFIPPVRPEKVAHARDFFFEIGLDETSAGGISEDELYELRVKAHTLEVAQPRPESRLIVEGEDIQNVYLGRVGVAPLDSGVRRKLKTTIYGLALSVRAFLRSAEVKRRWASWWFLVAVVLALTASSALDAARGGESKALDATSGRAPVTAPVKPLP